ncbi:MAG: hypothetical protein QUV07_12870 [Cyanobium sp. CZS 25K]|nr:hypothetical protein [Cyanobium sp. CZS25K]
MTPAICSGAWAAVIGWVGDGLADPASIAVLQERLARHGAELSGQVPELLLRTPDAEAAVRSWLADKDLSHWIPRADGGTAAQGWQFETAGWNRARGAEPVRLEEMGRTHLDGGVDALLAEGVPQAVAIESLEAALLGAGLRLGLWLLQNREDWSRAGSAERRDLLAEALKATGVGALSGVALSLVLSVALALVPGGQVWLMALSLTGLVCLLPAARRDPFDLSGCR